MSIHASGFGQSSINSWMLSHSNELNAQCDQSVAAGYTNVEEQEALKEIQNTLASTGHSGGYGVAQKKIEDFLAKYGKNEEIARLAPQLQSIADRCGWDEANYRMKNIDIDSINEIASDHGAQIQVMCDKLSNNQKYGDIERQDLSSRRDQVFQAANSLTSSQNQAIDSILTTLRG